MAERTESNANPYLALGVRPFINCCSVRTMHGGSLMLPRVRAAMDAASRQFVNLDELMEAAGKRLAELTGAEWGIVTCGSAAAVALASAACVAGNDPVRMLRLPFTDGWVNRVILPKNQRFAYDQAIRMVGAHIVEIDSVADLEAALREPVAMVAILGTNEEFSKVRLEEIVARVKPLRHSDPGGRRFGTSAAAEPVAATRRRHGDLQRRKIPARAADQRTAARQQEPGAGGVAQRLAASGVRAADEGVEGGRDRRAGRGRILAERARRGGRTAALARGPAGDRTPRRRGAGRRQRGDRAEGRGARAGAAREVGRHRAGRHGSAPAPARGLAAHHDRRHVGDREFVGHRSVPVLSLARRPRSARRSRRR